MHGLLTFPPVRDAMDVSVAMCAAGIGVRSATTDDVSYLNALYRRLREDELSATGWPESFKRDFLDSQFSMQHRHYVEAYASGDFWVVEHRHRPIGRYYVLRDARYHRVIDISLDVSWRRRGIGGQLLDWTQTFVRQSGAAGIDLSVDERNVDAQRLYARYGFVEAERQAPYIAMRWTNPLIQLKTA
jgi:ribosomal protein S18 acetylase RimI-like enzyme